MYYVYVLKSLRHGKRYVGLTGKLPAERLQDHLRGSSSWTNQNGPFELIYSQSFEDKCAAQRRERFLKTGQGRRFIDGYLKTVFPR